MNRQELNQKIWITDRLLALVRKSDVHGEEQTELIDHLETWRTQYRLGLQQKLLGRA